MSRRTLVLLLALGLAALAAFSIWRYLDTVEGTVREGITEVRVFRASQPIEAGVSGAVAFETIQESTALADNVVFEGSRIVCPGPVDRESGGINFRICDNNPRDLVAVLDSAVAAGPISAGQLITADMFVQPSQLDLDTLSTQIPQGKVAMSLQPGDVASVAGYIKPGDHVNIIASFTLDTAALNALLADPLTRDIVLEGTNLPSLLTTSAPTPTVLDEEGNPIEQPPTQDALTRFALALPEEIEFTQTILQDLPVLAVGTQTESEGAPLDTGPVVDAPVVVELTTEQAEVFEFARQRSELAMSLLPKDLPYTNYAAPGVTVDDIFDYVDRVREQLGAIGGG